MASDPIRNDHWRGLQLAGLIGSAWLITLIAGLRLPIQQAHPLLMAGLVLLRSFLHTGLFIVAHDAMHGSLIPHRKPFNRFIGQGCLWAYAGLSFQECLNHHIQHHHSPGSETDPDYCSAADPSPVAWYARFLSRYLNPMQLLKLASWMGVLLLMIPANQNQPLLTLALIYVLPLIISSWQLFVVGTFLPHRKSVPETDDFHQPISLDLHPILSFAACYHFGYHREHHNYPAVPWHQLPEVRTVYNQF